jgi:KRAB domain-containing zinc finger protein
MKKFCPPVKKLQGDADVMSDPADSSVDEEASLHCQTMINKGNIPKGHHMAQELEDGIRRSLGPGGTGGHHQLPPHKQLQHQDIFKTVHGQNMNNNMRQFQGKENREHEQQKDNLSAFKKLVAKVGPHQEPRDQAVPFEPGAERPSPLQGSLRTNAPTEEGILEQMMSGVMPSLNLPRPKAPSLPPALANYLATHSLNTELLAKPEAEQLLVGLNSGNISVENILLQLSNPELQVGSSRNSVLGFTLLSLQQRQSDLLLSVLKLKTMGAPDPGRDGAGLSPPLPPHLELPRASLLPPNCQSADFLSNESIPQVASSEPVESQQSGVADRETPGDPPRMAPEVVEEKIREIAKEIALQCDKSKKSVAPKMKDHDAVKTKQKLTYHEKLNKNHQLFSEHIKEESLVNSTMYSCKTCSSFPSTINRISAERHAKKHGLLRKRSRDLTLSYECSFCDERFKTKKAHVQHYQTTHCENGLRKITCTKCLKSFDDTASLKLHMKNVHLLLKTYKCDQCEKTFRDLYSLSIHIKSHSEVHHLCSQCGSMFETKRLLNRHMHYVHKDGKNVECKICGKRFRDRFGLNRHLTEGHKEIENGVKKAGGEIEIGEDKENVVPVRKVQQRKQVCPLCDQTFKRLDRHLKHKHGVNKVLNPDFSQNKFQCKSCGKPMRDKFNMDRHDKYCDKGKDKEIQCRFCQKKFFSNQNLLIHVKRIHETNKKCNKCSVTFETKYQFFEHLPCHHTCECLQNFPTFRNLVLHRKKCKTVNRRESESEYHNVISYKCGVCEVDGIRGEELRLHMDNHHEEDGISRCRICLLDVSNLLDHIFDKHHVVRRMKKSYIQLRSVQLHPLHATTASPTGFVVAVKSEMEEILQSHQQLLHSKLWTKSCLLM